jgi:hypothetical protein
MLKSAVTAAAKSAAETAVIFMLDACKKELRRSVRGGDEAGVLCIED